MTTQMNGEAVYNGNSTNAPYANTPHANTPHANTPHVETDPGHQLPESYTERSDLSQLIQEQFGTIQSQIMGMFDQARNSEQWQAVEHNPQTQRFLQEIDGDEVKRWATLLGGGYLALQGARRSMGSLAVMGIGVGLVYYALTGRRPLAALRGEEIEGKGLFDTSLYSNGVSTTQSIIVSADVNDVFDAWANFENFPHFMQNIKSVVKTGEKTSHWIMQGPLNTHLEWDAQVTRIDQNKRIAWNSTRGDIKTSGQVTFNSLPGNEVEVTVMLKYVTPAGLAGEAVAELFGSPKAKLQQDLRNFKQYIEQSS